jgi:L-ascorbate metabolism protein UlaG (beta-lactamase superfamily)
MVEATHSAAAQDEQGTHYVGVATGFVLSVKDGPVLYHSGDTNVFGDMTLIAQLYHPEIAMIPIGGFYTMGPKEAALAARLLEPQMILPIHWGTFPALTGTPKELAEQLGAGIEVKHWNPGDTVK